MANRRAEVSQMDDLSQGSVRGEVNVADVNVIIKRGGGPKFKHWIDMWYFLCL